MKILKSLATLLLLSASVQALAQEPAAYKADWVVAGKHTGIGDLSLLIDRNSIQGTGDERTFYGTYADDQVFSEVYPLIHAFTIQCSKSDAWINDYAVLRGAGYEKISGPRLVGWANSPINGMFFVRNTTPEDDKAAAAVVCKPFSGKGYASAQEAVNEGLDTRRLIPSDRMVALLKANSPIIKELGSRIDNGQCPRFGKLQFQDLGRQLEAYTRRLFAFEEAGKLDNAAVAFSYAAGKIGQLVDLAKGCGVDTGDADRIRGVVMPETASTQDTTTFYPNQDGNPVFTGTRTSPNQCHVEVSGATPGALYQLLVKHPDAKNRLRIVLGSTAYALHVDGQGKGDAVVKDDSGKGFSEDCLKEINRWRVVASKTVSPSASSEAK